jgi:cytochrome c oxidase subunit II
MDNYYGMGLPIDISTHGEKIDFLIRFFHVMMLVLFVGWLIYFCLALYRFRARPGHKATYKLNHFKTPTYIEVGVAVLEIGLLAGFSYPIMNSYHNELPQKGEALEVRVVAEQFAWNVHYPGPDGRFGRTDPSFMEDHIVGLDPDDPAGQDDIAVINQFHVPVNQPVIVHLSSKDVIHSFALPVARIKQDTVPGQTASVWFEATQTGEFEIACAQLCGLGHYRMKGFFVVETPEAFQAFLKESFEDG